MKAIGIDLGTTNSVAACCRSDSRVPTVLANSSGENLTPSVVSVRRRKNSEPAEVLVGRAALNNAAIAPEDTILSIKRLMGRDYADPKIAEVSKKFNYKVVKGPGDDPRARVHFDGHDCTPTEISSYILGQIKTDVSRALGEKVTHAVITVPAYFNEGQRAATREAGELAGLVVKKIIDEPTAAAVAFGVQAQAGGRHRILVYDMGGGTFDISILQMVRDQKGRDQYQVLQTEGDNWLGGDDFDRKILQKIVDWVQATYDEDPSKDSRFLFLAKSKAEEARKCLSHTSETDIVIPAAYKTSGGILVDVDLNLGRAELESMIQEYLERSMALVEKALKAQSLTPNDISDVLLVGGATLTPLVYQTVEGVFGSSKVRRTVNPMECVALGAGILAATLRGVECPNQGCKELNDEEATSCRKCETNLASGRAVGETGISEVTAMALGIEAVKGNQRDVFAPIIPKGTPYPLQKPMTQPFQATARRIVVPVYEGDKPVASQNAEQGVIEYKLPEEMDSNTKLDVSFNYDRNRQLTVTISVPGTTHYKQQTLRRDLPRTVAAEPSSGADVIEAWRDELERSVEFALGFLEHYGVYMDPGQAMKLRRDIENAQKLLVYSDEVEGRRMARVLQADVFTSGLATQLFLADRASEGAAPEVAKQISEAARDVRQSFETGARGRATEQARILSVLVGKAVRERGNVESLEAQEDFGGLLRLLGD